MNSSTKAIAFAAFLGLIGIQISNLDHDKNQRLESFFENLWERGSIKLDTDTKGLVIDEKLLGDLKDMGQVLAGPAAKGHITEDGCV